MTPGTAFVRQADTHRLIPSKYSANGDSLLTRIANDNVHLRAIFDLDGATNDRLIAEHAPGHRELLFGIPNARIVNAAFTHPNPAGSRFNGPDRGAWYARFAIQASQAEVAFHKARHYAEINRFEDSVSYDDCQAGFAAEFHDLRDDPRFADCLSPTSYIASQTLAQHLFDDGALGIVYPSVRHDGGTCLACFRPALVGNVRKAETWRFTWAGSPQPKVTRDDQSRG